MAGLNDWLGFGGGVGVANPVATQEDLEEEARKRLAGPAPVATQPSVNAPGASTMMPPGAGQLTGFAGGAGGIMPTTPTKPGAGGYANPGAGLQSFLQLPSSEPQHVGLPMADVRAGKGGYGTTPSGGTYGYAHGADPEAARMNALGRSGGLGDQADAFQSYVMRSTGLRGGPNLNPEVQAAAMKNYSEMAKQATSQGKANVEEYLGVGNLGVAGRQAGVAERGATTVEGRLKLDEAKQAHEEDKNVQRQKFHDALALMGKTPAEIDAAMKARDRTMGKGGAADVPPGPGGVPFDPDRPDAEFETAIGPAIMKVHDDMAKNKEHPATIMASLEGRMGKNAFLTALNNGTIQRYIDSRLGQGQFTEAANPSQARTLMRRIGSLAGGAGQEAQMTSKLRNFLGWEPASSGPFQDFGDWVFGNRLQKRGGPTQGNIVAPPPGQ